MNIQNSAVIEAAARLAAARAGRDESEAQSVTAFVRTLYKDFSPHQCGVGSTADELAAAALPLWRAAAGAAGGARARAAGDNTRASDAATYRDRLGAALAASSGDASELLRRYGDAFPSAYRDYVAPEAAAADIASVETVLSGEDIAVSLTRGEGAELRLKTVRRGEPVALSDVLPMLENLGLHIINEIPFEVRPADAAEPIWIQEFQARSAMHHSVDLAAAGPRMEEALRQVWAGAVENDALNRLILVTDLSARDIVVLRTYAKFLRQSGSTFSNFYIADTLAMYPAIAQLLVRLFKTLFDPATPGDREAAGEDVRHQIIAALESVENLDRDRILRAFVLLIRRTLRTNFYQRDEAGQPKSYLSIKLSSQEIDLLPLPRPLFEIFVYSPRMEGCHLRGGRVARGGLRWSDRKEDFRTEILGLMKAQMVKNAVIVPTGSKGGFVVKRPPEGREALMAEVVACYKMLMGGLLDLTDNIEGDTVVPPVDVVRRDQDDPFLVVAADKGTATFSDIANGVAIERGFWLGDAYASGGSVGYDHKAMGITSQGRLGGGETPLPRTRDGYPDHRLHLRRRRRHVGRRVRQWHAAVPAYKAHRRV